jgi:hypothetical protein
MMMATVISTVIFLAFNSRQSYKVNHMEKYIYEQQITFLKKDATSIQIEQDTTLLKSSQGKVK